MESKELILTYVGMDSWDRPVYKEPGGRFWEDVSPMKYTGPQFSVNDEFDGEPCDGNIRIGCGTVPEGKYRYEAAGDDGGGELVRVWLGIMIKFFGTLISDQPLPIGNNSVLCLDGDFIWL